MKIGTGLQTILNYALKRLTIADWAVPFFRHCRSQKVQVSPTFCILFATAIDTHVAITHPLREEVAFQEFEVKVAAIGVVEYVFDGERNYLVAEYDKLASVFELNCVHERSSSLKIQSWMWL